MVLFNIYDDWLRSISSYTAFSRLILILRALHVGPDKARMLLRPDKSVITQPHHVWPTLTDEQWIKARGRARRAHPFALAPPPARRHPRALAVANSTTTQINSANKQPPPRWRSRSRTSSWGTTRRRTTSTSARSRRRARAAPPPPPPPPPPARRGARAQHSRTRRTPPIRPQTPPPPPQSEIRDIILGAEITPPSQQRQQIAEIEKQAREGGNQTAVTTKSINVHGDELIVTTTSPYEQARSRCVCVCVSVRACARVRVRICV